MVSANMVTGEMDVVGLVVLPEETDGKRVEIHPARDEAGGGRGGRHTGHGLRHRQQVVHARGLEESLVQLYSPDGL